MGKQIRLAMPPRSLVNVADWKIRSQVIGLLALTKSLIHKLLEVCRVNTSNNGRGRIQPVKVVIGSAFFFIGGICHGEPLRLN